MKNMQKNFTVSFIIIGVLVGTLFTVHFRSNRVSGSDYPTDELEARGALMEDFLNEQAYLQSRITYLRDEIDEAQQNIDDQSQKANLEKLGELKKAVGISEVAGPGLMITINDSTWAYRDGVDVKEVDLVQAADLRDLVNILEASHAEAIDINGQRIVVTSTISSVGTTILVNNTPISPPFEIKAAGDTELMLQRLKNETLLPAVYERASNGNIYLQIEIMSQVTIPPYSGEIKTEKINLIE